MNVEDLSIDDPRVSFVEVKPAGWAQYIKVNDLYKALNEANVPPAVWPGLPSDNKCCGRGLKDIRPEGRRHLVRPLPKSRGWALVIENGEALDLEAAEELRRLGADEDVEDSHKVEITVKVQRAEDDEHVSSLLITPDDHPAAPMIREAFRFHRGTDDENMGMFMCSEDLSVWFSQIIMPWCRAVSTRSRGGSYYVLREHFSKLKAVSDAISAVSEYKSEVIKQLPNGKNLCRTKVLTGGRIIVKPEVPTSAAVEILIDSVVNEMDREIDKLDERLRAGSLGTRALDTQASRVGTLGDKLKEFEDLLGVGLTDVRDRLAESEAGVGLAKLKVEAEKESRAA